MRTSRDFWVEMSIREISTQAHFAGMAYGNLDRKAKRNTDVVFSSIHSFLSHCAMISKLLAAKDDENPASSLGDVLGIQKTSVIHERLFRNHLEHYDERLKKWISQFGANANVGTYNIGPKSAVGMPDLVFVSHYDPDSETFTFVNDDFDLRALFVEARRIKGLADKWVSGVEQGVISPPFM